MHLGFKVGVGKRITDERKMEFFFFFQGEEKMRLIHIYSDGFCNYPFSSKD